MAFREMFNSWMVIAAMLLGLSTVLVSIIYMLASMLQNEKMKGWAKIELTEVFYSAIIILMALYGLGLVDSIVQGSLLGAPTDLAQTITFYHIPVSEAGLFGQTRTYDLYDICGSRIAENPRSVYHGVESCHIRLGIWYLREIFDEAKAFAFDIYLSYIGTSMLAEFTINIEFLFEKAGFFTFTPWRGFFTMGNKIKELVFDWAIKIMMLTKFQEVLLYFIGTALFPSLFTLGVVLRTFALTRRLGGLLIGMALALYFVFPAFYAFGALVMLEIKNDQAVRAAWIGNSTVNPGNSPDPPIANTMYMSGAITMPGGGKTSFNASDAQKALRDYEGLSSSQYLEYMEKGKDDQGGAMLPMTDPSSGKMTDLTSRQYKDASDPDKDAALAKAKSEVDNWFKDTEKQGKLDKFVGRAWKLGGPLDVLGRLTFWSVFFSLFGIIATIAAIRSLSITFGGDIEIAGLTRLI